VEIITKYADRLACWVSEEDRGQPHAINKGFHEATGEIVAWLNSDDFFFPGAFQRVSEALSDPKVDWVVGNVVSVDAEGRRIRVEPRMFSPSVETWFFISREFFLPQQGSFWRRSVFHRVGYLLEDMNYSFDYEFFFRMLVNGYRPMLLDDEMAGYRFHDESKSVSQSYGFYRDNLRLWEMYRRHCPVKAQKRIDALMFDEALDIAVHDCECAAARGQRVPGVVRLVREGLKMRRFLSRKLFWATIVKFLSCVDRVKTAGQT